MAALVLGGAAAKGAFEAGVVAELLASGVKIRRIVASSAGALSGLFLASRLRAGSAERAGDELVALWRDHAKMSDFFSPSAGSILHLRGLSSMARVGAMLEEFVRPCRVPLDARKEVDLTMVVTSLRGELCAIAEGEPAAVTHEKVFSFQSGAFDSEDSVARMRQVALASATIPGLFSPTELPEVGPCYDGGLSNNAPIRYALEGGSAVDTVYVVVAHPAGPLTEDDSEPLHGVALASRLVELLINERFYRDLREASQRNASVLALENLVTAGQLSAGGLASVRRALGWEDVRPIRVVTIRPQATLQGDALAGFLDADLRAAYIEEGRRTASKCLEAAS